MSVPREADVDRLENPTRPKATHLAALLLASLAALHAAD
jgi:hypothetical protein